MLIFFLFIPPLIFFSSGSTKMGNFQHVNPKEEKCVTSSYHYEAVPGKLLGMWPNGGICTQEDYINFKKKYGFSGCGVIQVNYSQDSPYQRAINAGFEVGNIMVMVWDTTYIAAVKELPAGSYYLDEPVEHDCSGHATNGTQIYPPDELRKREDYVHSVRPGSKFIIGGYKRCSHLQIASGYADNIMYTSYVNWNSLWFPVCHVNMGFGDDVEAGWAPGSSLQADSWSDMRSKFGAKFSMSWMDARGDEYSELFKTANSLGLEGIWLYALQGMGDDPAATLENFCQAAVENGWLKRVDDYIAAPLNLTAGKSSEGYSIKLSWQDISDNEKGFVIERKLSSSDTYTQIASVNANTVSFTDSTVEDGKVYSYRIKAFNDYNSSDYSNEATVSVITPVDKKGAIPKDFELFQNHPNPYNPETVISYALPSESHVKLSIYNLTGSVVKTLLDRVMSAGYHEMSFNAEGYPSGIYFYIMEASPVEGSNSFQAARKMLLLK